MAGNAFALKSLAVTVVAAVIALSGSDGGAAHSATIALVSIAPIVLFWLLDAHYMRIERAYRHLFDAVRRGDGVEPFAMDSRPYWSKVGSIARVGVSSMVMALYPALIVVLFVLWQASQTGVVANAG